MLSLFRSPFLFLLICRVVLTMLGSARPSAGRGQGGNSVYRLADVWQSFEVGPLERLDRLTDVRLVQLVAADGGPADEAGMTYAEMVSESGGENTTCSLRIGSARDDEQIGHQNDSLPRR